MDWKRPIIWLIGNPEQIFPLAGKSVDWKLSFYCQRLTDPSSHSLGNQWIGNKTSLLQSCLVFLPTRWEISGLETELGADRNGLGIFPLAGKSVDWKHGEYHGPGPKVLLPTRWEISGLETHALVTICPNFIYFPLAGKSVDWKLRIILCTAHQ